MKQSILLTLCILVQVPIFGMSDDGEIASSACRGLGTMVYNVTKSLGRNDFLYLAHVNSSWFLRKKLESKEHFEDRDRYYVRFGRIVEQIDTSVCYTPLQEAVYRGHVATVKLLCAAGADVDKKIKTVQELTEEEMSNESHGVLYFSSFGLTDPEAEIQEFKAGRHVGCSALELAKIMRTKSEDKPAEREEIELVLMNYAKKD